MYSRFAIYYAPRDAQFAAKAASWLGWDPALGREVPLEREGWEAMVRDAQKYGFHGTIKAPFRMTKGLDLAYLQERLEVFAAARPIVQLAPLTPRALHGFLALVPQGDVAALNELAFATVRHFDDFRAPLSVQDIARRNPECLTERQRELMQSWGYPNVAEHFNFHLTLTGRLETAALAGVERFAQRYFAAECAAPFVVEDLCLFGEAAEDGRFHMISRHALS